MNAAHERNDDNHPTSTDQAGTFAYETPQAFRAALTAQFKAIAKTDPRYGVNELQRQFAYDRTLARCFSAHAAAIAEAGFLARFSSSAAVSARPPRPPVASCQHPLYHSNMVSRGRHPKTAIARALDAAKGLDHLNIVEHHKGHRWGWLICLTCHQGAPDRGHPGDPGSFTIWGTPEPPENHAKQILRFIARHEH